MPPIPIELLTGQSPAVLLALIMLWMLNRNYIDHIKETREIVELVRTERAEWIKQDALMQDRLLSLVRSNTEAQVKAESEIRQLRNLLARGVPGIEQARRQGDDLPPTPRG